VSAPKGSAVAAGAVALGNAVANDAVVDAILAGFAAAPHEPLAARLVAALECGLAAGGEPVPLRSAALRVAQPGIPFTPIDLRVDRPPVSRRRAAPLLDDVGADGVGLCRARARRYRPVDRRDRGDEHG
jgi:uncharacterized Ntn-hydrolase superfamily protein